MCCINGDIVIVFLVGSKSNITLLISTIFVQVVYWLSISPGRWGLTRVGILQQAFFQGWLLLVLLTSGALRDPVLIDSLDFCYTAIPAVDSNGEVALSNGTNDENNQLNKKLALGSTFPPVNIGGFGAVHTRWAVQIVQVLVVLKKYILEWPASLTTLTKAGELTFSVCQRILNFMTTFDREYRQKVSYMELSIKHPS